MATGIGARAIDDSAFTWSTGPQPVDLGSDLSSLDTPALWLAWAITGVAIAIVVGVHVSFGGHRLL